MLLADASPTVPRPTPPTAPHAAPPGARRAPELLLGAAMAVNLAVYAGLPHLPYQDAANHAARYALIERAWFGTPVPWVRVLPVPAPYLGLDAVGAVLAHAVGPVGAVRVVGAVALCALPLGLYALLRRVAPAQRVWAVVGALLSYSFFLLAGMLNYHLATGALLFWLAAWWPRRAEVGWRGRTVLAVGATALYALHLAAVAAALAVVGADLLQALWATWRAERLAPRGTSRTPAGAARALGAAVAAQRGRALTLAVCAAAVVAALAALAAVLPPGAGGGGAPVWRNVLSKGWALTLPFFTFSPWEMVATLPAYLLALAAWARANRAALAPAALAVNPIAAAVVALGLLFLATPLTTVGGAGLLDVRWLLPPALLAFAAAPGARGAPPRWAGPVLLAGCVAHAAVVTHFGRRIERELGEFDAVLEALPSDARVFPLVVGPPRYARVEPYLHYALLHTARTGARGAGLFSYTEVAAGAPPITYFHFGHFRELDAAYQVSDRWGAVGHPVPPWPALRAAYDCAVLAGRDARAEAMFRAGGARPVLQRGAVSLWALDAAGAGRCATAP